MKKYIAHAGIHLGSTVATQNSMRSIQLAAASGFDFCELDVWLTSDGVPVVVHNATINATYCSKYGCEKLAEPITVNEHTFADLRENYIGIADDPIHRAAIPTLAECLTLTKSLGIVPMIHPKNHDDASVAVIMAVCDKVMGARGYYIVAENDACDFALARDPEQPCMPVAKGKEDIDHFAAFPNTIIAIRRAPDYIELVNHAHEHAHPVETTLNDDVHADHLADVINYDYLSPGRFDRYEEVKSEIFTERALAAEEVFRFWQDEVIHFGTVEAAFRMQGEALLNISGREFRLNAPEMTDYRAAVLVYDRKASVSMRAESDVKIEALQIRTGKHNI